MSTFTREISGVGTVHINVLPLDRIINAYGKATGVRMEDLVGPSKFPAISAFRHELMYLIRKLDPSASYSLIGRFIGGRDMATVHEAVAKVEARLQREPEYNEQLSSLMRLIKDMATVSADELLSGAKPWQLIAACQILRDDQMTDAEARKAALSFLQQLEASHG